jgi:hypothetical protein
MHNNCVIIQRVGYEFYDERWTGLSMRSPAIPENYVTVLSARRIGSEAE